MGALVVQEFRLIFDYAMLLGLPTSPASRCYVKGKLVALPAWVKGAVAVVVLVRLFINVTLGRHGAIFLCYTMNLQDFIMNSLALGFIYTLDEMVYDIFIHKRKKKLLDSI